MGNIRREVLPISRQSWCRIDSIEVNKISRHHPVIPHSKKYLTHCILHLFIIFIKPVCTQPEGICAVFPSRFFPSASFFVTAHTFTATFSPSQKRGRLYFFAEICRRVQNKSRITWVKTDITFIQLYYFGILKLEETSLMPEN